VTEHIPRGAPQPQPPQMSSQRIYIFEPEEVLSEQPSKVIKALVLAKRPPSLDEMSDQVGDYVFVSHSCDWCREKRSVDLRPREQVVRGNIKEVMGE
jgi:hypothetical protein